MTSSKIKEVGKAWRVSVRDAAWMLIIATGRTIAQSTTIIREDGNHDQSGKNIYPSGTQRIKIEGSLLPRMTPSILRRKMSDGTGERHVWLVMGAITRWLNGMKLKIDMEIGVGSVESLKNLLKTISFQFLVVARTI